MLRLKRPSDTEIRHLMATAAETTYTYPMVGVTQASGSIRDQVPPAYEVDYTQATLGHGRHCFEAARQAVREWQMFTTGWIDLCYPDVPVEKDAVVGVLARTVGLYSLNLSRVIYVQDEPSRFGFAYGTLPQHVERGEERFLVWHDPVDDTVWYSITAVSDPAHWLVRLGKPFARHVQRIFAQDSVRAMRLAAQHSDA